MPDIACYSKGLTGGALSLAVTLCRQRFSMLIIQKTFPHRFFHSGSYMANPVVHAAAKANLDLRKD
ncbi:hypothetical protein [Bradyrhizobium sp. I1.7.5]|uniref:hypothetical protein n=1 Tax=Bradyrhizobium sp. I1.7.5 TaxID=3156363 RepID=UPI003397334F